MALPHMSIATTDEIEFVNLEPLDINPLMSKCQIKVMYTGENDHGMIFNKDVCKHMAKTLRGCAIVGSFREDKDDFSDHGEKIVLDSEGIHFSKETIPYGFVAPDAKVWFQKFEEEDRNTGQIVIREYLVTEGYLWTENYEPAKKALEDGGRPHSMEIDKKSIKGEWSKFESSEMEFFIVSDGIFSQLCILGEDVEPCFEGSSITPVNNFSLNGEFVKTLSSMMKDLQFALNTKGDSMEDNKNAQPAVEEPVTEFAEKQGESASENIAENENNTAVTDFVKNEDEKDKDDTEKSDDAKEDEKTEDNGDDDDKKKADEYALKMEEMQQTIDSMQAEFSKLKQLNTELLAFKTNAENEKKDALISEFYMLSDEDKKDVITNKANYSLDEIKSKLAVLCFEKKVNFGEVQTESKEDDAPAVTFNLNEEAFADSTPDWVKAVKEYQSANNN